MDDCCYICELVPGQEQDHFPAAKRHGGHLTLPICRGCHDAKDRFSIESMNPATTWGALAGLWTKATREERVLLAKVFALFLDAR